MMEIKRRFRLPLLAGTALLPLMFLGASVSHIYASEPDEVDPVVEETNTEQTEDLSQELKNIANAVDTGAEETPTEDAIDQVDNGNGAQTEANVSVEYQTHVQNAGWQEKKADGEMAGTSGESLRLQGIKIQLKDQNVAGSVEYRTHIQNTGWEKQWTSNGSVSGTTSGLRLEAIQIRLTGEMADKYDIYYSVHAQNYGWLAWVKNGEAAGTAGYSYRLEGIRIQLLEKNAAAPTNLGKQSAGYIYKKVQYSTHIQNIGWQAYQADGVLSGTTGQAKRLEAIKIKVMDADPDSDLGVSYAVHIQDIGWQAAVKNGKMAGTSGQSKRLEAIKINLTGADAEKYDIYYTVHVQNIGWLGWAKNGELSGTSGGALRLEGIRIRLLEKDAAAPKKLGKTDVTYAANNYDGVQYQVSYFNSNNYDAQGANGSKAGASGKKIDSIKIKLNGKIVGTISYRSHIQNVGWESSWKKNDAEDGIDNRRTEAIQIKLSGDIANLYNVYYRTQVDDFGWLGWAKDGASAGTKSLSEPISAIEVKLVLKGSKAPGNTKFAYVDKPTMDMLAKNYSSSTNWLVMVDKTNFNVGIFKKSNGTWKKVKSSICGIGKKSTPTVEGQFTLGPYRNIVHRRPNYSYWYVVQWNGDYLFHTCLFRPGDPSPTHLVDGRMQVGISHGCVRLPVDMAKYIYYNVPDGSKVVVYH